MIAIRAAVHVHSDRSFDGTWSLPRIVEAMRRRRYRVVMTAEHSQSMDADAWHRYQELCEELSSDDILVVPGVEYRDADNQVHIPTWGPLPYFGDGVEIAELLRRVHTLGGVGVLAHPDRREAWAAVHDAWGPHLAGVEVWNRKYDGWSFGQHGSVIAHKLELPRFASLDFHGRRQLFPLATTILVEGPVTRASVEEGLRAGRVESRFLRVPLERLASGPTRAALDAAERLRRGVAPIVRRVPWRGASLPSKGLPSARP